MGESFDVPVESLLRSSCHYFINQVYGFRTDGIHGQMIDFLLDNKFGLVLAPRGHGKSKIMQGVITWKIVNDPNARVIIVSDTDTKAQMFLRTIKSTIENSQVLKDFYGDMVGDRWTDHALTIKGRTEIHTEPSLLSVGAGSGSVTGFHCDELYIDDIVSFDSSRAELQRVRIKDWYRTTLLPVLLASGNISIAGTRYHYSDFYDLIINDLEYPTLILPAINPDGSALCEWLVPLEDKIGKNGRVAEKGLISIKKDLGSIIFSLQYLNNVDLLKEGNIFRYEWIQFYDNLMFEDGKVFVQRGTFKTKIVKIYAGVDLAISQKDSADYTVVTVVGQGEDKKLYVLDIIRGHLSYQKQKDVIRTVADRWDLNGTIIESTAYQAVIIEDLRAEGGMKITPVSPTKDKTSRAMAITGWFENSNLFFRKNQMSMIDELLLFPDGGAHDDQVDSLCYAVSAFRNSQSEMVVISI